MKSSLQRVQAFLREIGLPVREVEGVRGFLGLGVAIERGTLVLDPHHARPSTLLHEAGHLCIVPACYRSLMDGNLHGSFRAMGDDWAMMNLDPDDAFSRAMIQISDPEVTAWAWAAGQHLGLRPEEIIEDEDYNGTGEDMRLCLRHRAYCGIHGLKHAGFCEVRANPFRPDQPVYPELRFWVQPAQPPAGVQHRFVHAGACERAA